LPSSAPSSAAAAAATGGKMHSADVSVDVMLSLSGLAALRHTKVGSSSWW